MKNSLLPLMLLTTIMSSPIANLNAQDATPATEVAAQPVSYVSTNGLRVRATPEDNARVLGTLSLNDQVRIVNPGTIYAGKYVEIVIVKTYDGVNTSPKYYVNKDYVVSAIVDYKVFTGKYFIVVNVATETVRLYERVCADNSCPNKMILESEVVVGEDIDHAKEEKGKGRSILGSYRIVGWTKFYQDSEGHYPSWYKEGYPDVPAPGDSGFGWFSKKSMPLDEHGKRHGEMRGAFGWYTAFVEPEPYGQWLHGTIGWGADKDAMIKRTKSALLNVVSNPRSSGCTRNNNEAIAFFRKMVDVGTPIVKVYAKEELLDPTLSNYPNQTESWDYVMTKTANHAVDRQEVLKNLGISSSDLDAFWEAKKYGGQMILDPKSPLNEIIEVGTYEHDVHPDVIAYTLGEKLGKFARKIGRKGNVYGIKSTEMHGTFYVDAGLLEGYAHPDSVLESSGFADETTPPWMKLSNLKQ